MLFHTPLNEDNKQVEQSDSLVLHKSRYPVSCLVYLHPETLTHGIFSIMVVGYSMCKGCVRVLWMDENPAPPKKTLEP